MLQQVEDSKFSVEESTRPSASNPVEKVLSLSHVSKHTHIQRERERERERDDNDAQHYYR